MKKRCPTLLPNSGRRALCVVASLLLMLLPAVRLAAAPPEWQRSDNAVVRTAFADACDDLLLEAIRAAKKEITVAAYSFTRREIADALVARKNAGVKVRIKIDADQADSEYAATVMAKFRDAGIAIERIVMAAPLAQHNKFMVIDQGTVLTGSFNYSSAAADGNWENLVRIDSTATAARFLKAWEKIRSKN